MWALPVGAAAERIGRESQASPIILAASIGATFSLTVLSPLVIRSLDSVSGTISYASGVY